MGSILITSGLLRGRHIQTPAGCQTRPLLTRLRKSLADILRPRLAGTRVLDLFGGSGAIAFELVSNGAAAAVIVELTPQTAQLIKSNAGQLGIAESITVISADAIAALKALSQKKEAFDIIIIAPPYGLKLQEKTISTLSDTGLLKPGGMIVVQREDREEQVPPPCGLILAQTRRYGRTLFDFYEPDGTGLQTALKEPASIS